MTEPLRVGVALCAAIARAHITGAPVDLPSALPDWAGANPAPAPAAAGAGAAAAAAAPAGAAGTEVAS
jgi:hypothetical protein